MSNIALSIAGGGVKALLGLGVYRALRDSNIEISTFAGMSAGGIIASLLALNLSDNKVDAIIDKMSRINLFNFNPFKFEILSSQKITVMLDSVFANKDISALNKKLVLFATDLNTQEPVVLTSGNITQSLAASFAQPPYFKPVILNNMKLVDGGFSIFYGAQYLKKLGAEKIIGVDPGAFSSVKLYGPFTNITDSILVLYKRAVTYENKLYPVDVEINEFNTKVQAVDFHLIHRELISVGYQSTAQRLDEIRKAMM